eukprot:jgi/Mesvir1/16478/Mv10036-RA.2
MEVMSVYALFAAVTGVKLLFMPAYRSTDFEVHRNWMAITSSLPLREWYVDATSQWTLDYPPLFAYFERLLALGAAWFDPAMLAVRAEPYASDATVLYQRVTVILTDALLFYAVYRFCHPQPKGVAVAKGVTVGQKGGHSKEATRGMPAPALEGERSGSGPGSGPGPAGGEIAHPAGSIITQPAGGETTHPAGGTTMHPGIILAFVTCSAGLFIVDHVHFQYNGPLLGLLIMSLAFAQEGRDVASAVTFAALVCAKHLFAYAAPAYAVFLLRRAWEGPRLEHGSKQSGHSGEGGRFLGFLKRMASLVAAVAAVVGVAFGPFLWHGQLPVLLARMFPFGRGLCHAYWAPNFWALYNLADKALTIMLPRLGYPLPDGAAGRAALNTGGLVGSGGGHVVLPQVVPGATFVLVLVSLTPALWRLWQGSCRTEEKEPGDTWVAPGRRLVRAVAYCYLAGFVFGWHVHEKACLMFTLPFALLATGGRRPASLHLLLSTGEERLYFPLCFCLKGCRLLRLLKKETKFAVSRRV